jgi:O-antigen/teichoic acid export membrane protein
MEHEPGTPSQESLTVKTVKGSAYTITASAATLVLGLGRSILMARLLVPDDFGLVALAMTFLHLTTPLRDFGFDYALVHRKADDTSPDEFLSVHFSLRLVQICLFVLLLLVAAPVLYCFYPQKPLLVPVLLGLTLGEIAVALGSTQLAYLRKEMRFMELSVLQVLTSLTMTVVGHVGSVDIHPALANEMEIQLENSEVVSELRQIHLCNSGHRTSYQPV